MSDFTGEKRIVRKRTIVVTGASSGIGKCITERLAENGYRIIATSRSAVKLGKLYSEKENVEILAWDLSDTGSISEYAKKVSENWGPIDGFIHCAGIEKSHAVTMIKERMLAEVFNINTFAAMLLVSRFSKKKMMRQGGSFVLITSAAAHNGTYGQSVYAASKAALSGFVKATAAELAEKQFRINAIAPGIVQTGLVEEYYKKLDESKIAEIKGKYPLGTGEPTDIAAFAEYLISERSRWVTGQSFILDGGFSVRKP